MPAVYPDIGTGTTIALGTGTFTAYVLSIDHSGASRAMIDVSHMATTGGAVFIAGEIYDPGELSVSCLLKTDELPPIGSAIGTVVVTFPDASHWDANGAVSGFSFSDPMEDKMTIDVTIKLSGTITPVAAPA